MSEKSSAVSPRPESNSSAIDEKNAPKLYATPKTTKVETNVAATIDQPRCESNRPDVALSVTVVMVGR